MLSALPLLSTEHHRMYEPMEGRDSHQIPQNGTNSERYCSKQRPVPQFLHSAAFVDAMQENCHDHVPTSPTLSATPIRENATNRTPETDRNIMTHCDTEQPNILPKRIKLESKTRPRLSQLIRQKEDRLNSSAAQEPAPPPITNSATVHHTTQSEERNETTPTITSDRSVNDDILRTSPTTNQHRTKAKRSRANNCKRTSTPVKSIAPNLEYQKPIFTDPFGSIKEFVMQRLLTGTPPPEVVSYTDSPNSKEAHKKPVLPSKKVKEHQCDDCCKTFLNRKQLTVHIRGCKDGKTTFNSQAVLLRQQHLENSEQHLEEDQQQLMHRRNARPAKIARVKTKQESQENSNRYCQYCSTLFKTVQHKVKHGIREHPEHVDPIKCDQCDFKTETLRRLHHHKVLWHKAPPELSVCDKCETSVDKRDIAHHFIQSHSSPKKATYECDECKHRVANKQKLLMHKQRRHNKGGKSVPLCDPDNRKSINDRRNEISNLQQQEKSNTAAQLVCLVNTAAVGEHIETMSTVTIDSTVSPNDGAENAAAITADISNQNNCVPSENENIDPVSTISQDGDNQMKITGSHIVAPISSDE